MDKWPEENNCPSESQELEKQVVEADEEGLQPDAAIMEFVKAGLKSGVEARVLADAVNQHSMLPSYKRHIRHEVLTGGEIWEFGDEEPEEDVKDFVRWLDGESSDEEMPALEAPPRDGEDSESVESDETDAARDENVLEDEQKLKGVDPEVVTMCTSLMTYLSTHAPEVLKLLGFKVSCRCTHVFV